MKQNIRISLAALMVVQASFASAATVTTLDVDFESPFVVGPIGGNPPYSAGQQGWGYYASGSITTAQAHSGTQSLRAGGVLTIGAQKALDPATQGEYPSASNTFPTGYLIDWWVQAWVRVDSGGDGARLAMDPWGWYLQISGDGTPTLESANGPVVVLPSEGADLLDQWVMVSMVHNSTTDGCNLGPGAAGRCIDFGIHGTNVDITFSRYYTASGPFSNYVMLTGDAYWDDVAAGTGSPPPVVPLPGAAWLLVSALGALGGLRRRR